MSRTLGGRYRVDEEVGHGGMATVWRGYDLRLRRAVAVKILDPAMFADAGMRQRFWREAQAVAALSHPHIVAVYDVAVDADEAYVVMELVDGPSVSTVLQDGPLPWAQAVDVAVQTCAALAAAHAAGMVHRDVTPANLLLSTSGLVKVCDFGIAAWQEAAYPSLVAGTRGYTAPEQAAGGPVDPRTDLYGLGCTLYAMLTGAPPPVGRDVPGALSGVSADLQRAGVAPELAELVEQLTAADPGDRPGSAEHAAALLSAVGATATTAYLPGTATVPGVPSHPAGPAVTPSAPAYAAGSVVAPGGSAYPAGAAGPGSGAARPPGTLIGVAAVPPPPPPEVPAAPVRRRPERPDRWLRPVVWATTGIVAIVAGLLFIVYALGSPTPPATQAGPSATPNPAAVTPASAPRSPTGPARPGDQLGRLRREIDRLARSGGLTGKDAADLRKRVQDIEKRLRHDGDEAADKAQDLLERLDKLRDDGKLSDPAYRALAPLATHLSNTLD
ncbi:protein kinase [Catellatospora sp. NPDC049609]|uniref:serine/threonine-protein kinase n=1 Tax=Catellatospora sp. NPDC049609 TaxID=3155505 RepID=UPI003447AE1B